ncbi:MAG: cation diffusion facilitator family transporter [Myxococcales bacterium]
MEPAESEHDHHGHVHGHGHLGRGRGGERQKDRRRLLGTLVLTLAMMVFEAIGGWASGSLALLSDAGHMLTDAAALLLAALALWFAGRPADLKRTYGFFRLEILSALVNGLTLIGIALLIGWEAYQRITSPQPIKAGLMLVVAVVGLAVNLAGLALLSRSKNMNVRAAFLHVLGDALSSVGVIAAGAVAFFTGWTLLDPILSIAIALIIAFGAVSLLRQAVHVLLEAVPEHIDLVEVFGAMKSVAGVAEVHDLHVWTISHSLHALSAHLVCNATVQDRDELLTAARTVLRERFGIDHATLQIESEAFAHREHTR